MFHSWPQWVWGNVMNILWNIIFKISYSSWIITSHQMIQIPQSQKPHGLKSGDGGGQGIGKWRLMACSSVKYLFRTYITQWLMHEEIPSCIKIMCKRHRRAFKSGTVLFCIKNAYCCLVTEHIIGLLALKSSKKYGPRIKDEVNPHHTVTFGNFKWTCMVEHGFSGSQTQQLWVFKDPSKWKCASSVQKKFQDYSKSTSKRPKNRSENRCRVSKSFERTFCKSWSLFTDYSRMFRMIFWTVERDISTASATRRTLILSCMFEALSLPPEDFRIPFKVWNFCRANTVELSFW